MRSEFIDRFNDIVELSANNNYTDNYDYRRFGYSTANKMSILKELIKKLIQRDFTYNTRSSKLAIIRADSEKFQWLYEHLMDEESKYLLIMLLAYRALGYKKVKLPLNTPEYWERVAELDALTLGADKIDLAFMDWQLWRQDLAPLGYPIELLARPSGVMAEFILQQYSCITEKDSIKVEEGDYVIDAGGCYGDTALYFAAKTGEMGRIFSFEFLPESLKVFEQNLSFNPTLSGRIHIIKKPLWSNLDKDLYILANGPGTKVVEKSNNPTAKQIKTTSIDSFMLHNNIPQIDFIKMDIEGSELEALKGAEQTINKHKPKLAIAIYHRLKDFWEIPQWIDSLNLGYTFRVRHFTIHHEETVLFAAANSK
jgi:FkbM family methyltransferase